MEVIGHSEYHCILEGKIDCLEVWNPTSNSNQLWTTGLGHIILWVCLNYRTDWCTLQIRWYYEERILCGTIETTSNNWNYYIGIINWYCCVSLYFHSYNRASSCSEVLNVQIAPTIDFYILFDLILKMFFFLRNYICSDCVAQYCNTSPKAGYV